MRFLIERLGDRPDSPFPDPLRSDHPEGLIAVGGDLAENRLLNAYRQGIFPWFEAGGPILWWCPNPRAVLIPNHLHVPRRLQRTLRQSHYTATVNRAFQTVVEQCASERGDTGDTWITPGMMAAYDRLHESGRAHSLEIWRDEVLIGGIYGVAIGTVFFAESKFHRERDASKIALVELVQ
ncbi:MAG: leucyl/phenylalanyl-tRNA--protein transferase, partial [Pseudomonadota bacterium]